MEEAIGRVCESQHFILGPEVEALEAEIATLTGAVAAVGCSSGTEALWLALAGLGIGPGDAVITTAFSFFASGSAIARAGARPVFVDVDPDTLNLDPEAVRTRLRSSRGDKFRALLPVHLYGQCADIDALMQIATDFGLEIVEDAAQAIGADWKGKPAGSLGKAAAFSFYPTKNLSAYGDAGMVTTVDRKLAEHMQRLRNHGSPRRYYHEELGWNSRIDAIQAAVLRVKLPYLESWNAARRERAANYDRLLLQAGLSRGADAPVKPLGTRTEAKHIFHQYVVRAKRREDLRAFLNNLKIGTEIYYPVPLHLQEAFAYLGYREGDLPVSETAAKEVLALPIFPELTHDEQAWVVEKIAEFYS
jgi:dTDP-4-amino-4,6-dideoxygalactose transaminase